MQNDKSWYQKSAEDAFDTLESSTAGLSTGESRARLEKYGYNELKFKKRSVIKRFLMQFHSSLIYVLLVSALVTSVLDM